MDGALIIAILSFCGTAIGTLGGIMASSKLTNYRIEQLEKKVDVQNNLVLKIPVFEEQIKDMKERLAELEKLTEEKEREAVCKKDKPPACDWKD